MHPLPRPLLARFFNQSILSCWLWIDSNEVHHYASLLRVFMMNLTKYDIAFIGVKLLAIYIALQLIGSLPSWLMTISMMFGQSNPVILKFFAIILPLLSLLISILLWVLANKIAALIAKTKIKIVDNNNIEGADNDLQTMLFCAIGIFILVTTIPEFIAWVYAYIRVYIKTTMLTMDMFQQAPSVIIFIVLSLKILLSIILIFTAKNLSAFFHKLRYAGNKK